MSMIEHSNQAGRFSETELRSRVAASKSFWNSPAGRAAAEERAKRRAKPSDTAARNVLAKLGIA